VGLTIFAFGLSGLEAQAMASTAGTVWYLAAMVGCVAIARAYGRRVLRSRTMTFDLPDTRAAALRLSEA